MTTTILWADGFDNYNLPTDALTLYSSISWQSLQPGRTNGLAVYCRSYFDSLHYQNFASQTDIGVCFALKPTGNSPIPFYIRDISSGAILATVDLSNPNLAKITCNGVVYTGPIPIIPINNFTHISFHLVISPTAGSFTLIFNGTTTVFTQTNINTTANSGTVTTANAVFLVLNGQNGYSDCIYDDFLIYSGNPPGDCRLQTDFPISNAGVQFTPLANSNWQEVSEVAMDSDTSYNSTSTVGNTDLFNFPSITVPIGSTIIGCFVRSSAAKTDAGTRSLQNKIVSGSNSALGASTGLSTSYQYQQDNFTSFLSGLGLLTPAGVSGATIGYTLST